jgi:hypothetical protein
MTETFEAFDFLTFWDNDDYSRKQYIGADVTDEMIQEAESELGYRLPQSYIEFLKQQNGGTPKNTNHHTKEPTSWADDHVAITGIFGIDKDKPSSLCGEFGSKFWVQEWGYPDIGICICDCPSGGHDMIFLDYGKCGPGGEPEVVHIDQERDYEKTFVAKDFETFIRGLEPDEHFR